jgi:3-phenylpropionate/trans-cinnamate dioxygenase ferredoxin reductase subunit
MFTPILFVGAGQAAAQAVETLRKKGHVGPLTVVGDEDLLPYQRPPLSKKYLSGAMEKDRLLIRHADHYAQHTVDLHQGIAAAKLDCDAHRVEVTDGSHIDYEKLLLATGSRPR